MKYNIIVKESLAIFNQYKTALTLRQLFYRLVAKRIIDNTLSNYKGLSRIMVKARERKEVSDFYIEDRTRRTFNRDNGYNSPEEFVESCEEYAKDMWQDFRMPLWKGQPKRVEVWVEKDALARICSEAAGNFNVVTCPSRGYSSYTYIKEGARRIGRYREDPEVIVLYFGDYDPSGLDIERDLGDRLLRYGVVSVEVQRVALTLDQIKEHELPPMPAKTSDPRLAKFVADTGGAEAVELDALEPDVLTDLIKESIEKHIDLDVWDERKEEIEDAKADLEEKFKNARLEFDGED